jgi:hypothetical protein
MKKPFCNLYYGGEAKNSGFSRLLPHMWHEKYRKATTIAILPNTLENGFSFTKKVILSLQPQLCQRGPYLLKIMKRLFILSWHALSSYIFFKYIVIILYFHNFFPQSRRQRLPGFPQLPARRTRPGQFGREGRLLPPASLSRGRQARAGLSMRAAEPRDTRPSRSASSCKPATRSASVVAALVSRWPSQSARDRRIYATGRFFSALLSRSQRRNSAPEAGGAVWCAGQKIEGTVRVRVTKARNSSTMRARRRCAIDPPDLASRLAACPCTWLKRPEWSMMSPASPFPDVGKFADCW